MRIAFTGHRPDKLVSVFNDVINQIDVALNQLQPEYVITGGALGVDQLAAGCCRRLGIPYEVAVPFPEQTASFSDKDKEFYMKILEDAKAIHICVDKYEPWAFQVRNEYMVDNCDLLIACWDGSSGGTANCVKYAKKVKRDLKYIVWPHEEVKKDE